MSELPRKWCVSGPSGLPTFPRELTGKLWVKIDGQERHAVCALDQDEGWVEMLAFDRVAGKAVPVIHGNDMFRYRIHGVVEQGLR